MTREEAINILIAAAVCSTEYLYCDEHCPFYHPEGVRVCNDWNDEMAKEAVETISALREQEHFRDLTKKVEPLTLNELRQLPIRDWVWIEILNPDAFRSKETVSAYYRKYDGYKKDEIFWCGYPGLGFGFDYADYGKTWLAYRQKPEDGTV